MDGQLDARVSHDVGATKAVRARCPPPEEVEELLFAPRTHHGETGAGRACRLSLDEPRRVYASSYTRIDACVLNLAASDNRKFREVSCSAYVAGVNPVRVDQGPVELHVAICVVN